ncbi:type I secretion C-terminal target domain-containing protein [Psychromonas sp. KJ10-2]|uniref:type I secretion C-terminal target domain-containing protein n=1 Tax=Psychromonas sp. KJ10-2 TaxID=3391822 RepID=UPI0039B55BEE
MISLQDESAGTLSNYFDISFDGNDTTLTISSTENGYDNTTIVLEDTKLEGMNDSTTGNLSDNEVEIVINTLYDEGALIITDDATTDVTSSTASLDDPTL